MRILFRDNWTEGFLDYYRRENEYRIKVCAWLVLESLDGLYFVRPVLARMLWNYLREFGILQTARKIISRQRERARNDKYISCGIGVVLESPGKYAVGSLVIFIAPFHPRCVERITLPEQLLHPATTRSAVNSKGPLLYLERVGPPPETPWWAGLRGWHPESARSLEISAEVLNDAERELSRAGWSKAADFEVNPESKVTERRSDLAVRKHRGVRTVLFGYGQYAKTIIIPNLAPRLLLVSVHEIDPTQVSSSQGSLAWDTSPILRGGEKCDAAVVAGYHHTHALLAIEALRRDCYVIVEKPLVTDEPQLIALIDAVSAAPKLFACFQRRYLPFNDLAREDLGITRGDPISYHAMVYEVPLPHRHWYRWPSSRNRLIANGCHWIDHFLFLNDYAPVHSSEVALARDGTVNCSVELENSAFFTMVLTERGSERIGVQDYVELRANGVTAKLTNASRYEAEGKNRILRRRRINRIRSYQLMYRAIGQRIAAGEAGDSLRSVEVGSSLMLSLASRLDELAEKTGESCG